MSLSPALTPGDAWTDRIAARLNVKFGVDDATSQF
jgi:hypothetical protein